MHDAWNRLVEVREGATGGNTWTVLAQYEFNGLHWRTVKRVDTDRDGTIDQRISVFYDASWRMIQQEIDDGFDPAHPGDSESDRIAQQFWGLMGINDAVARRETDSIQSLNPLETKPGDLVFQLTDVQSSVVATIDTYGNILDRVLYDPYGRARHRREADFDGNDALETADIFAYLAAWLGSDLSADLNRDGAFIVGDIFDFLDRWTASAGLLGAGEISETVPGGGSGNEIGYCGYVFDAETQDYCVRYRTYSPALGRFLERDPAGFVDGCNLYEYVDGSPLSWFDPLGLAEQGCGAPPDRSREGLDAGHPPQQRPYEDDSQFAQRQQDWWDLYYARHGHNTIEEQVERVDHSGSDTRAITDQQRRDFGDAAFIAARFAKVTILLETIIAGGARPGSTSMEGVIEAEIAASNIWALPTVQRGNLIHKFLGANLPHGFKTIDRFVNGIATSIKSVDVRSVSYLKPARLLSTLKGFINSVWRFKGARYGDVAVTEGQIAGRELIVAIPKGAATAEQQAAMIQAAAYGEELGVTVRFVEMP